MRPFWAWLAAFLMVAALGDSAAMQIAPTDPRLLTLAGTVEQPLTLGLSDLSNMPQRSVHVTTESGQKAEYRGVLVADLLARAGAPLGEALRGPLLARVVIAEAADGYRAVFALAEIDPATGGREAIVAFARDGKPLAEGEGPLRLIVPDDRRRGRWVRQLRHLRLEDLR